MKKIMITGGNGFIGRYTVNALINKGYTPLVFDRHDHHNFNEKAEFFLGDIRDATAVTEAMAHADGWIHLAGVLGTAETILNPRPAAETNIIGGLNVLEAACQYNLPGINIAVGNYWENNTYSLTKNTVERFAVMFALYRNLKVNNLRALNAYGPQQSVAAPFGDSKVRKITPSFVCRAITGNPIEIYGDGTQIMDMIYVGDVADSLVAALEFTEKYGHVDTTFEAGSGINTTVNDIAQIIIDTVGSGEINHLPMRIGETPNSVVLGNPETLRPLEEFGLSVDNFATLEQAMIPTVKYFREYLDNK